MKKVLIDTRLAPAAVGPYSQGVVYRNILYVSGQIGLVPNGETLPEDFITEVKNTLYNVQTIVEAAGSKLNRVLKTTILLTDMEQFQTVNSMYKEFFPEDFPARECYAVASLPKGARIEISAVAFVREDF
jgi:2-iminobutanoate/2-iminopropanoate deaminase